MTPNLPGQASAEALELARLEQIRIAIRNARMFPRGPGTPTKPTATKNIFAGWAPGAPHMTRQKVRRGSKTEIHIVPVPTRRATYTFGPKEAAAQRALYARPTNFNGEVAR